MLRFYDWSGGGVGGLNLTVGADVDDSVDFGRRRRKRTVRICAPMAA